LLCGLRSVNHAVQSTCCCTHTSWFGGLNKSSRIRVKKAGACIQVLWRSAHHLNSKVTEASLYTGCSVCRSDVSAGENDSIAGVHAYRLQCVYQWCCGCSWCSPSACAPCMTMKRKHTQVPASCCSLSISEMITFNSADLRRSQSTQHI